MGWGNWGDSVEFSTMVGKILVSVVKTSDDELLFVTTEGEKYRMYHSQNCCESVTIDDICGGLEDLIGSPILVAEEATSEGENPDGVPVPEYQDSFTWTFYKIDTAKGGVTIRWYGGSNGYYSESVDFEKVT
jgi:hypothetical protein